MAGWAVYQELIVSVYPRPSMTETRVSDALSGHSDWQSDRASGRRSAFDSRGWDLNRSIRTSEPRHHAVFRVMERLLPPTVVSMERSDSGLRRVLSLTSLIWLLSLDSGESDSY